MCKTEVYSPSSHKSIFPHHKYRCWAATTNESSESSPRRTMCWDTGWFLSQLVHEICFQLRHVNGDPLHTFRWKALKVQKNKHVALLMFMELEPRGAPIGRNWGRISQSQQASISGKLLLIYFGSSEIIGSSRKSFFLLWNRQWKNNHFISIRVS